MLNSLSKNEFYDEWMCFPFVCILSTKSVKSCHFHKKLIILGFQQ